ncbi:MAG: hypothetical protein QOD66_1458, partial [Solirubrobacteraceae bacterium]|nr:hypothetical protein [Solirubrobacteraceae bacterium]
CLLGLGEELCAEQPKMMNQQLADGQALIRS